MICSCGKRITRRDDPFTLRMVFQHGENPEHVRVVTGLEAALLPVPPPGMDILEPLILEWIDQVHAYEAHA